MNHSVGLIPLNLLYAYDLMLNGYIFNAYVCSASTCSGLPTPAEGQWNDTACKSPTVNYGTICALICPSYLIVNGSDYTVCGVDGWIQDKPTCIGIITSLYIQS